MVGEGVQNLVGEGVTLVGEGVTFLFPRFFLINWLFFFGCFFLHKQGLLLINSFSMCFSFCSFFVCSQLSISRKVWSNILNI